MTYTPQWLTTRQAAEALEVSPGRIRQFVLEGRLPARKGAAGRDLLIRRDDLEPLRSRRLGRPVLTVAGASE